MTDKITREQQYDAFRQNILEASERLHSMLCCHMLAEFPKIKDAFEIELDNINMYAEELQKLANAKGQ